MSDSTNNDDPTVAAAAEQKSLTIAKWANLFMAVAGLLAAWLSRSDALLVDGLFSGVNFLAAIIAARVGISVVRPPDSRRPFGYEADEAVYVTFRSMTLIGVMALAMFNAVTKILNYAISGEAVELIFGPIQVYVLLMVVISAFLAYFHHRAYVKSNRRSELLLTERRAAIVDGAITAAAGAGLLLIPFLKGTALEIIIPVADSIIVLILVLVIIGQPVAAFRKALGELAGESAGEEMVRSIREVLAELAEGGTFKVLDVAVTKIGRLHTVIGYLDPERPVAAAEIDAFNIDFGKRCGAFLGHVRTEIVLTERPRQTAESSESTGGA